MSLINCPNCEKEISDKSYKCIHCNKKLFPKKDDLISNIIFLIISFIFSIILFLLFCRIPTIYDNHINEVSFTKILSFYSKINKYIFDFIIIGGIFILDLFICIKNKALNIIAKIGYVLVFLAEVLVILIGIFTNEFDLELFYIIPLLTITWIIYSFIATSSKDVKVIKEKVIIKENKNDSKADELIKLKQLLDNDAITKEEYQKLKDDLIK